MDEDKKTNNPPSHNVFRVDGQGSQATWTKVGVLFQNKGEGYSLILHDLKEDLRFVCMVNKPRD